MQLIDGKQVAAKVLAACQEQISELNQKGATPGLAVILVGDDPASRSYVRSKDRKSQELGIHSEKIELPESTTQEELVAQVERLNQDPKIHGILVQSPLPSHIDERAVVETIDPKKDVDGFHVVNVGKMVLGEPDGFIPCTPAGCVQLLEEAGVELSGAEVVIIGRSMIVGKPLALLLMGKGANATVTVAHSRTRDLAKVCRRADILIAAIGKAHFVTPDFVKEGAVVIDVGVNRIEDASRKTGYRLVGDVDFEAVAEKAAAMTPVPGGVGPMTIANLMANTVKSCQAKTV